MAQRSLVTIGLVFADVEGVHCMSPPTATPTPHAKRQVVCIGAEGKEWMHQG